MSRVITRAMGRAMGRVMGIGWWTPEASGCLLSAKEYEAGRQDTFRHQFKNFGRLDRDSKAAAYAVALALEDAGLSYPIGPGTTAGIAGGNYLGCLNADIRYFRDYIDCGRTLGRGNYFIYTLPSSPLAECSIHFGLEGPILYLGGGTSEFARPLEAASEIMADSQADLMLAGVTSPEGAMFMVLAPRDEDVQRGSLGLKDVMDVLKKEKSGQVITGAVGLIQNLMKERGIKAAV
jgi:hypothetical protein